MMRLHSAILLMVLMAGTGRSEGQVSSTSPETIVLESVVPIDAPMVEKGMLKQKIDLMFDRCPNEYWVYYNQSAGRLVIEFFGVHVKAHQKHLRGTPILSDLKVVNSETLFSLNGKNAQISMLMKQGWHFESWVIGGKVLRLHLWIPLDPQRIIQAEKKRSPLPLVIIIAVVTGISAGVLLALFSE